MRESKQNVRSACVYKMTIYIFFFCLDLSFGIWHLRGTTCVIVWFSFHILKRRLFITTTTTRHEIAHQPHDSEISEGWIWRGPMIVVFFGYYKIDKAFWATGCQDGQSASLGDVVVVGLTTQVTYQYAYRIRLICLCFYHIITETSTYFIFLKWKYQ